MKNKRLKTKTYLSPVPEQSALPKRDDDLGDFEGSGDVFTRDDNTSDDTDSPFEPISLTLNVSFNSAESSFFDKRKAIGEANRIVKILKDNPSTNITIRPQTNWPRGKWWKGFFPRKTTEDLVRERGEAFKKLLIDQGIDINRIKGVIINDDSFNKRNNTLNAKIE